MNPSLLNIWDTLKGQVSAAATNVAAAIDTQTNAVRSATADAIAQAGAGASIAAAASVAPPGNVYQKIEAVGADWRAWAVLGVLILVTFYFLIRRK